MTGGRNHLLPHLVREAAGEPEGAFVLLHGRGSDEHDLHPLFDILDPDKRLVGIAPGAPLSLPPGGRHWYVVERVGFPHPETFLASTATLEGFLDGWLAERGIGWERTILGGFSQGTAMSYAVGLGQGRPSPAGILAMSGFIPTVEGWEIDLASRRDVPVLIAHGTQDPVIGSEFGEAAAERLRAAGLDVETHFSAAGHHIDPRTIPVISDWVVARGAASR